MARQLHRRGQTRVPGAVYCNVSGNNRIEHWRVIFYKNVRHVELQGIRQPGQLVQGRYVFLVLQPAEHGAVDARFVSQFLLCQAQALSLVQDRPGQLGYGKILHFGPPPECDE